MKFWNDICDLGKLVKTSSQDYVLQSPMLRRTKLGSLVILTPSTSPRTSSPLRILLPTNEECQGGLGVSAIPDGRGDGGGSQEQEGEGGEEGEVCQ